MKNDEFQKIIMPHLDAAYNYALWLSRDAQEAEDLTQEASFRALCAFGQFKHNHPRAWLLTIVRNIFLNHQKQKKQHGEVIYLDTISNQPVEHPALRNDETPEQKLIRLAEVQTVTEALDKLPTDFREILILRELHGFSYDEIAEILDCAVGTVMSRLSRARNRLRTLLHKNSQTAESSA